MTINNQHGGPCRNSKAVFEGGKFCLPSVIEVKATEVGILVVLETFCGLKLTCTGIFSRDHRVKVTKFQSKAQQESVKRSNINNGKILRNSPTSSYWPSSKKEKKKNKVTANFFKARPLNGACSFFLI